MNLFADQYQIMPLLPNALRDVPGERAFIEKLAPYIEQSTDLLEREISGNILDISNGEFDNSAHFALIHAQRFVVYDALVNAIPFLDLVFTPNGIAVAQTASLAPASSPRIDRLIAQCTSLRDDRLADLIEELRKIPQWLASSQGRWFAASILHSPKVVEKISTEYKSTWKEFKVFRQKSIDFEESLAEEFISPEEIEDLRSKYLAQSLSPLEARVIAKIENEIINFLHDKPLSTQNMMDAVNIMRNNPDDFPLWHSSATARLFSPPRFVNKKNSPGYFF